MHKGRLEAFSDGVIAIIITIMVLELKPPHSPDWAELLSRWPIFLAYVISFIYVGIYWNNHHHLLQMVSKVNGKIMLANLNLLFWLSLLPFTTAWAGENHFAQNTMILYGINLLSCSFAYQFLQSHIICDQGVASRLRQAIGSDMKGKMSVAAYCVAVAVAFFVPWVSALIYALVAMVWLLPDRRIEHFQNPD
jgi:uncharacterized membrane protein